MLLLQQFQKKENEHIKARGTAIKSKQTIFDFGGLFLREDT